MNRGKVIRLARIYRADLKNNRDILFAFGDNMERFGMGGQAGEMRGEPNAVGIPTKRFPANGPNDFFGPEDVSNAGVILAIDEGFQRMKNHILSGGDVVIPADGLGTGLSELPERAPALYAYIVFKIRELSN